MKHISTPFKWRHYPPEIILLCVRWHCRGQLSYRDVEEMLRERGAWNEQLTDDRAFVTAMRHLTAARILAHAASPDFNNSGGWHKMI